MFNFKNIRELLQGALKEYGDRPAFNVREKEGFSTIGFSDFIHDVFSAASSLAKQNIVGKHIAMIGENSYQWIVTNLAIVSAGGVIVPIDKELTQDEVVGLVEDSDATEFFYSPSYFKVAGMVREKLGLKLTLFDKEKDKLSDNTLFNLINEGKEDRASDYAPLFKVAIEEDKVCSIVYTSGTTGVSKGVMLSHTNFVTNIWSAYNTLQFVDNRFSLLPMHHTFEYCMGVLYSIMLGKVQSLNNSVKYIAQNLQIFKPTDLVVVPLIAETLYNAIWTNIRKSGKEKIVLRMIKLSRFLLKCGIDMRRVFFKKIHAVLGGKVEQIYSGGALLDVDVARGFEDFGIGVNIGYGITECSPLVSGNCDHIYEKMGSCGFAVDGVEVALDNINENGEGEVIARGKNVMLGYYKNQAATDAVLIDGWFHTGDIGRFDEDGYMWITGRIKNIIVLKNGKNIYPEEIEGYVMRIPYVKEVVVFGEQTSTGEETSLSAEIFPDFDRLTEDEITDYKFVIQTELNKINNTLAYYKRVSNVSYREVEFEKTTSKKIKRSAYNGK